MQDFLTQLSDHWIVPLFLLVNLGVGLLAQRKSKVSSFEDYALAGRSLPSGVLMMTVLATVVSLGTLSYTGNIFYYGVLGIIRRLCSLIGFLFAGTFIAPYLVHFDNVITLGDLMRRFYGRFAQCIAGVVGCLTCLLMISAQVSAIGAMSSYLLGIPYIKAMLCFGGLVVLYSVWGGMRSVSYTDVIQGIAALVILSWLLQAVIQRVGGGYKLLDTLSTKHPEKLAFFSHPQVLYKIRSVIFWSLFCLKEVLDPPVLQRMLISQDKREVRKVWYVSAIFYMFICIMLLLIGLAAIAGEGAGDIFDKTRYLRLFQSSTKVTAKTFNDLVPYLIKRLFQKTWTVDVLFIGILGILFSTVDSYLHAVGILLTQDVLGPIRELFRCKSLSSRTKGIHARIFVALIGIWALFIGCMQSNTSWINEDFYEYSGLAYTLVIIPLILGIIGIKTDTMSWVCFCGVYLITMIGMRLGIGMHKYNSFIISLPLGVVAFLVTHMIRNRGLVTLKRSKQTTAEQLWIPTWSGCIASLRSGLSSLLRLPMLAEQQLSKHGAQPMTFSLVIFALYTLAGFISGGTKDPLASAGFMAAVRLIGVTLCFGLLLKEIWPTKLKRYFALYWLVTVLYCLPLSGTVVFFRIHEGLMDMMLWVVNFGLLMALLDSGSFLFLGLLGAGLAFGGWRLVMGSLPADIWNSTTLAGVGIIFVLIVSAQFFTRKREKLTRDTLYWNRVASSILGHEMGDPLSILQGVGMNMKQAFKSSKKTKNRDGEEGYWMPAQWYTFFEQFPDIMVTQSEEGKKDIQRFRAFVQQQVLGAFTKRKQSAYELVKEGIEKEAKKVGERLKIDTICKEDFGIGVVEGVFPTVIGNIVRNASIHGHASHVTITVDGARHTLTIRDNGKGIPPDVLPRIFDLHYTTSLGIKGSGIGLAFVKMVIESSGGKVSCHSKYGSKDSFTAFEILFREE